MKRAIIKLLILAMSAGSVLLLTAGAASADTEQVQNNKDQTTEQQTDKFMLEDPFAPTYRVYRYRTYRRRTYRRYRVRHYRHRRYRRPYLDRKTSVYIGLEGFGTGVITSEKNITKLIRAGGGLNLFVGWRFNRFIALELGWMSSWHALQVPAGATSLSKMGTGMFQAITIDAKIFFVPRRGSRIDPFIQIGGGGYFFFRNNFASHELSGGGLHVGIGLDIRLTRFLAIGARVLWKGIYLNDSDRFFNGVPTESAFINQIGGGVNLQVHF